MAGAVRAPSPERFESGVRGRRISDIQRRAKYLIFRLDERTGPSLIFHLRMTGSLVVQPARRTRPRHTRNVLLLDGGAELCFVDSRKLGAMWLVTDESDVLAGLGPEPLDASFTADQLALRLSGRSAPIKALLCDQSVVAGIGNIYADEVLFVSKIHPLRPGGELSARDSKRLHEAIVSRLTEATERLVPLVSMGGPPTESEGRGQLLLVPRSEGERCTRGRGHIRRIVVRGRGTYFCPRCQTS